MKNHTYRIVGLGLILASGCNQILGLNQGERLPIENGGNGGGSSSTGAMSGSSSTGGMGGAGGGCKDATGCPGTDDACQQRTCIVGVCGFYYAMMGMPAGDPTLGDCQQDVCNGNGGTMSAANDTDAPSDATVCTTDSCSNGIPTFTPVAFGTMCSEGNGTVCDGTGVCKLANGAVCAAGSECISANCVDGVCCDNACMGTCRSCNVAGSVGVCSDVPFGLDDVGTCSGPTQSCDDFGGCKKENGQSCSANTECWSNICNGGACTEKSCIGLSANCGPLNENCCVSGVVTGGTYNRSNDPMYPATVNDFRLDRFEITVGRFRKFVEAYPTSKPAGGAGAHPLITGSGWDVAWNMSLPADQAALKTAVKCSATDQTWTDTAGANEKRPMNCINWYEAFAFCAWDGGRLPTEAEWNYAAAGGNEQRQYPWSNPPSSTTIDATYAVYNCLGDGSAAGSCAFADILTIGSKSPKGDGRWGQADLAGSMSEWNLDWYQSPYVSSCNNCANLNQNTDRVLRGGSWGGSTPSYVLSSNRDYYTPSGRYGVFGARCARTP